MISKLEMVSLRVNFSLWLNERIGIRLGTPQGEMIFKEFLAGRLIKIRVRKLEI